MSPSLPPRGPKISKLSIRGMPVDVYPIAFMVGCALCYGSYVGYNLIMNGEGLRIGSRVYNPDNWQERLKGSEATPRPRAQNVYYTHIQD
ncbi:hypothetical protein BCR33DRAFT_711302 [Rhizoclosmatium globosum]|uniref:Uncharacterized protein n=1 Tax=Rhizoclosmatium globosum TaxID=329046 RepID=A0A1Y2D0T4_9FUNG|nr:hypothetical protein BCR33DRAFT_711302 [Rhizoclosmatium globosum]|eukprot:ORY52882.1 hypothetical protein BCR33DRAFT_711302 [Rhizoclosmatium globosum]